MKPARKRGWGGPKTKAIIRSIGHELKEKPPEVLERFEGPHRERIRRAILLSKARRAGARLPKYEPKKAS